MALTAQEQKYLDFALAALPGWVRPTDEFLNGAAKMFGSVDAMIDYLFSQALIRQANGATSTTPDWLNQHARDRGTSRQAGESDPVLRERIRNVPDALTRAALLAAADAILAADLIVGSAAMVELARDAGHWGTYLVMTGTGGVFTQAGTVSKFTPTALPWPTPPYQDPSVIPVRAHKIVIAGAADAGNDGTFTITGLDDDAAIYTNAAGAAGADGGVTWTVERFDVTGNLTDGFGRFYWRRGYRYARSRPGIVMILPFGTTAGATASIVEMLRQKKAAGVLVIVETRAVP